MPAPQVVRGPCLRARPEPGQLAFALAFTFAFAFAFAFAFTFAFAFAFALATPHPRRRVTRRALASTASDCKVSGMAADSTDHAIAVAVAAAATGTDVVATTAHGHDVTDADPDPTVAPSRLGAKQLAIHAALFIATCITTYLAGERNNPGDGPAFAATLMAILVCHEMGHYVLARRHHIDVSLPYFIPLPWMVSLGTLGAIIKMRAPIRDRNQLIDVGAAGPIAGLVIAIPALIIGLSLSHVVPIQPGGAQEGNSILYGLIKLAMFGRWLPAGGVDVQLHPMAFALNRWRSCQAFHARAQLY